MRKFTLRDKLPEPNYLITPDVVRYNFISIKPVPAVYVFVGTNGDKLYCGKAKNLRSRLYSHFTGSHNTDLETAIKENKVDHILVFECLTELDATILERYFIESGIYRGLYNIQFVSEYDFDESLHEVEPEIEPNTIACFIYEFDQSICNLLKKHNHRKTADFLAETYNMFNRLILQIMKKIKKTQIYWHVYEHDYGHLISEETKECIHRVIFTRRGRQVLKDDYNIEISGQARIKITYLGYSYYHMYEYKKGRDPKSIMSIEQFLDQLTV